MIPRRLILVTFKTLRSPNGMTSVLVLGSTRYTITMYSVKWEFLPCCTPASEYTSQHTDIFCFSCNADIGYLAKSEARVSSISKIYVCVCNELHDLVIPLNLIGQYSSLVLDTIHAKLAIQPPASTVLFRAINKSEHKVIQISPLFLQCVRRVVSLLLNI